VLSISDFEIQSQELQVHDSVAYELATDTETMNPQDGDPYPVRGRYLIVWHRSPDGRWQVHRNMFNLASSP